MEIRRFRVMSTPLKMLTPIKIWIVPTQESNLSPHEGSRSGLLVRRQFFEK